jgi:hypothetical protein
VPISAPRAFVFNANGHPAQRVRTLRQFVSALESTPLPLLGGHLGRGDFSRWIADVFGDRALADDLRALEQKYRSGSREEIVSEVANAVRARYDLTPEDAPFAS